MHHVFQLHIHRDPTLQALAQHQKTGFLNVNDARSGVSFGRVADPEDILGTVRLDNGLIVPGSYERCALSVSHCISLHSMNI